MDKDGWKLDAYQCATCTNEFWLENFGVDFCLNDPFCCPHCGTVFENFLDVIDEEDDEEG